MTTETEVFTVSLQPGHDVRTATALLEAMYFEHVLIQSKYNQSKAAKALGISRTTLRSKIQEYRQGNDKYFTTRGTL